VTTLLRYIAFMRNVFCCNGFNQTAIVLHYSAHIKPRKTIKPLNQTDTVDRKYSVCQYGTTGCLYRD